MSIDLMRCSDAELMAHPGCSPSDLVRIVYRESPNVVAPRQDYVTQAHPLMALSHDSFERINALTQRNDFDSGKLCRFLVTINRGSKAELASYFTYGEVIKQVRVTGFILDETDEHYVVQLIFPKILNWRFGSTVPTRYYCFRKDGAVWFYPHEVNTLSVPLRDAVPYTYNDRTTWSDREELKDLEQKCPVCTESTPLIITSCGDILCKSLVDFLIEQSAYDCPACQERNVLKDGWTIV